MDQGVSKSTWLVAKKCQIFDVLQWVNTHIGPGLTKSNFKSNIAKMSQQGEWEE